MFPVVVIITVAKFTHETVFIGTLVIVPLHDCRQTNLYAILIIIVEIGIFTIPISVREFFTRSDPSELTMFAYSIATNPQDNVFAYNNEINKLRLTHDL